MAQAVKIQMRRDTAANWTSTNPTLLAGEWGVETNTGKIKMGDGTTGWTTLGYSNYLANLKDVTITSLTNGQILQWNSTSSKWENVSPSGLDHTQHTDTGTTQATFQIHSGSSGPKLKNNSGVLEVRNAADNAFAAVTVGNLTVQGTTTTINSETLTVADNVVMLNANVTGTPTLNAGLEVERGTADNASILWDESTDLWKAGIVGAEVAISLAGHNHDSAYIEVISTPTAGNFPVMTAGGELDTSTYSAASFATAAHDHNSTYIGLPASPEQGDVLYYSGSAWSRLAHGTAYQFMQTAGHGANPAWADIDGGSA